MLQCCKVNWETSSDDCSADFHGLFRNILGLCGKRSRSLEYVSMVALRFALSEEICIRDGNSMETFLPNVCQGQMRGGVCCCRLQCSIPFLLFSSALCFTCSLLIV
jgi:hypothetical protein